MALHDNPPHRCNTLSPTVSRDSGGGSAISYSTTQSSVPCSINVASSTTRELFAQQGIVVDVTVAFLTSVLTTALTRGMKLTDASGNTFHVHGISAGESYGNIPQFTYAHCERQLG